MSTKISVIVATYNGEEFILEQLTSILEQTIQVDEVIISDDNSTDNTKEIILNFIKKHNLSNWKFLVNKGKHGISNNYKNAMKCVTGQILFLCDQDDYWMNNKVETVINTFDKNPDANCVLSSVEYIDKDDKKLHVNTKLSSNRTHDVSFDELLSVCSYLGMSAAFKKEVYLNINEKLYESTSHDWAMFVQAKLTGKVIFVGEKLQKYRLHDTNASKISGNSLRDKRLFLINRQRDTLENTNQTLNLNNRRKKQCMKYISFLKKREKMIKHKNTLYIVFNLYKYIGLGYTVRNFGADLLSTIG